MTIEVVLVAVVGSLHRGDEHVPVALRLQALAVLDPRAEGEAETELLGLLATGGDQEVASRAVLRDAVRAIQSRVEVERGGLAVAPETGALSEAPADRGRLSETE